MELALKALVLKQTGIRNIIKNASTTKTDNDLYVDFQNNTLKTKSFEEIKTFVRDNNLIYDFDESEYDIITSFQKYRNGIAHFSFKFHDGDYFDLKYDITYFVVNILIRVLCLGDDSTKPSEFLLYSLGELYHARLTNYPPYISAMQQLARTKSEKVYQCIDCNHSTYAEDEQYCYCCNFSGVEHSFRECEYCREPNSMIYDGLNLEFNDYSARGRCLNCSEDAMIFVCPKCEISYNLETNDHSKICDIGTCVVL